jgi:hypothetical protein
MKAIEPIQSMSEINEQYARSKRSIGICNNINQQKILVYGEKSLQLINHFSVLKIDDKITNNFYTLLMKRKKIIAEVLVLRLSLYRFLICTDDFYKVFKLLKKARKKYPITMVTDCSTEYSLLSFHGDNAMDFFKDIDYRYIFKTKQQDYTYYQLLCPKKDEVITIKHFVNLNFVPISLEVKKLFLYNNNIILNLNKIPRYYRLSVCNVIYPFTNFKIKTKDVSIRKYELEGNYLVTNKHKVYSYLRKKAGIIHCSYRLPNKKYPFVIAFVLNSKVKKVTLIKIGKTDALIRPVLNY